jgi:hypothetical protein
MIMIMLPAFGNTGCERERELCNPSLQSTVWQTGKCDRI